MSQKKDMQNVAKALVSAGTRIVGVAPGGPSEPSVVDITIVPAQKGSNPNGRLYGPNGNEFPDLPSTDNNMETDNATCPLKGNHLGKRPHAPSDDENETAATQKRAHNEKEVSPDKDASNDTTKGHWPAILFDHTTQVNPIQFAKGLETMATGVELVSNGITMMPYGGFRILAANRESFNKLFRLVNTDDEHLKTKLKTVFGNKVQVKLPKREKAKESLPPKAAPKPHYIMMKGCSPDIGTEQELLEQLQEENDMGSQILALKRIYTTGQKPTWLVRLQLQTQNAAEHFIANKIRLMFGLHKCEACHERTEPEQCLRCLAWGHSTRSCKNPQCCLRCGEVGHKFFACKKPKSSATCRNCGGQHAATYKGCTAFKAAIKVSKENTAKSTTGAKPDQQPGSNGPAAKPAPIPKANAWVKERTPPPAQGTDNALGAAVESQQEVVREPRSHRRTHVQLPNGRLNKKDAVVPEFNYQGLMQTFAKVAAELTAVVNVLGPLTAGLPNNGGANDVFTTIHSALTVLTQSLTELQAQFKQGSEPMEQVTTSSEELRND